VAASRKFSTLLAASGALAFGVAGASAGVASGDRPGPNLTPSTVLAVPGAPSQSCAARPQAVGCPTVAKIVIAPMTGDGTVGLVPGGPPASQSALRRSRSGTAHAAAWPYPGYQCGVTALTPEHYLYPSGNYVVRGYGNMDCLGTPKAISYMELGVTLERTLEGTTWNALNTNIWTRFGPGHLPITSVWGQAQYDCHHDETYPYRTNVYGYDVASGIGHFGSTARVAYWECYP